MIHHFNVKSVEIASKLFQRNSIEHQSARSNGNIWIGTNVHRGEHGDITNKYDTSKERQQIQAFEAPCERKGFARQRMRRFGGTLRLTARGRPKRSARFFLRSSSSGSRGSSGAPRFLAGCFLLSTDASMPKRSALAFSFPSFWCVM